MSNLKHPNDQTPQELVTTLITHRWGQKKIAMEVGTSQATISRIYKGKVEDPHHKLVDALRKCVHGLREFKHLEVVFDEQVA
jgi:predicted transcriptional regulator